VFDNFENKLETFSEYQSKVGDPLNSLNLSGYNWLCKKILLNIFEHEGSVKINTAVHKFQAQFSGVFRATRGDILKQVTLGTRMG